MPDVDKMLAALAERPVLAKGTFYDAHLGCGCLYGQLALKAGVPPRTLERAMAESKLPATERAELLDEIVTRVEEAYGIPEWMADSFYEWNDEVHGETPSQRYTRVVAGLPAKLQEWEQEHREYLVEIATGNRVDPAEL